MKILKRMMLCGACLLIIQALPAQTGAGLDPKLPGYFQLRSDQLKQYERSLLPKMNQYKQAADELADFGNHTAWVAHREANGLAEIHENWADLMFIISEIGRAHV